MADNAYESVVFNGRTYYECRLCCGDEEVVEMDEKDIIRHVFVDHLKPQSLTTVTNTLPTSPVANSADTSDGANTDQHIQRPPKLVIYGDGNRLPDQLNHYRKSEATKADQMRHYANKQSKSLSRRPKTWKENCLELLNYILEREDSSPFRSPVDPIQYPDYKHVIHTPMDLTAIKEQLVSDLYETPNEFCRDMRLVFVNCKSYNTNKKSRIYSMGVRLSGLFEQKIRLIISDWRSNRKHETHLKPGINSKRRKPIPLSSHTSGQPLPKRPRIDHKLMSAAKHDTNTMPSVNPYAQTSQQSSLPPTTSQPDSQPMDTECIVDTKRFPCLEKGCGKTFGFMQSLIQHRLKHSQRVNKTAANLITKANTVLKVDTVCHDWTFCPIRGYQRIGDKWFKVRKRDDRHLERHRKESFKHDHNYIGLYSLKPLRQWYQCDASDGRKQYRCLYEMFDRTVCPFLTKSSQEMARHLYVNHFRNRQFSCRHSDCDKVFRDPKSLRNHELNHQCRFGIDNNGKTMTGPCGNPNIHRFRRPLVVDGVKRYQCAICGHISNSCRCLKRHLHDQHLCPYRLEWIECSPPPGAVQDSGIANNDSESSASTLTADVVHEFRANNDSDDDLQIIYDENIATDDRQRRRSRVSPEITEWLRAKNVKTCSIARYHECMEQLKRLIRIRPFFEWHRIDGHYRYVCTHEPEECQFYTIDLMSISVHLKWRHFVN